MSYLKISYGNIISNRLLIKCIKCIGDEYGKDGYIIYKGNRRKQTSLEKGVAYLAKRCRTSKTAVKRMYLSQKIKNNDTRQWSFERKKYIKLYDLIIELIVKNNHFVFLDEIYKEIISMPISDILIPNQKDVLLYGIRNYRNHNQYYSELAKYIYKSVTLIDEKRKYNEDK